MKIVSGSGDFGKEMLKALGIDHLHVSSLKMSVVANKPVEVEVKFFLGIGSSQQVTEKVKIYNLASWDLVRFCQTGNGYL